MGIYRQINEASRDGSILLASSSPPQGAWETQGGTYCEAPAQQTSTCRLSSDSPSASSDGFSCGRTSSAPSTARSSPPVIRRSPVPHSVRSLLRVGHE